MRVVERQQEYIDINVTTEHVVFHIEELIRGGAASTHSLAGSNWSLNGERADDLAATNLTLCLRDFCDLSPYHICFTRDLTIEHSGANIKRGYPFVTRGETRLDDILEIVHPEITMNYHNFLSRINDVFVFRMKKISDQDPSEQDRNMSLKGKLAIPTRPQKAKGKET